MLKFLRWLEYRIFGNPIDPAWTPARLIQKYQGADALRVRTSRRARRRMRRH